MALKTLMLRKSIEKKTAELEALREIDKSFETREAEIEAAITEAQTEEEQQTVEGAVNEFDAEKTAHEEKKDALVREIADLENELSEAEKAKPEEKIEEVKKTERTNFKMEKINIRSLPMNTKALDAYSIEQRNAMMAQDDVKAFISEVRSAGKSKRDITGGELTIPVVFLDIIRENIFRYSKLMNRVRVRNVNGQARQTVAGTYPEAVWTEMCDAINELTLTFNQVTLDGYKVAGFVPVCNALLEDSDIALASEIVEGISQAIGLAKDKAILYGKGASYSMPLGIVTRLAQTSKPAGYPATAPAWSDLHTSNVITISSSLTGAEFWSALTLAASNAYTRYSRGNQFWAMNSKTYALLKSKVITFTATGDIVANVFGTLPVISGDIDVLEFIPDGDIIGGYGDLYLWAQRAGMTIEADRSVQFLQDNTVFRGKERADGTPVIAGAFVAININGQSVTTSMTFAANNANNATLNGLVLGTETLSPSFDPAVLTYSVTASNASDAITATPTMAGAKVAISYNGANVVNGGKVTYLADGVAHPVTVTVTNGNETVVYTVNVTKAA